MWRQSSDGGMVVSCHQVVVLKMVVLNEVGSISALSYTQCPEIGLEPVFDAAVKEKSNRRFVHGASACEHVPHPGSEVAYSCT
jgi:hypothetical protein